MACMTKRGEIAESLRRRILGAVESGALRAGDRLPSSRELSPEFGADPRVIAAAYRTLAAESLVEIRQKSGVFVSSAAADSPGDAYVPPNWLANVFVNGVCRGVPLSEIGAAILDHAETRRIRAAAIADTSDQAIGICSELKRDYGINATPFHINDARARRVSAKLANAMVIFAANDCAPEVREIARALKRPMIPILLRPDLFDAEWLTLMEHQVYVVATDLSFIRKLSPVISRLERESRVHLLQVGRDDLSAIPHGAPTYVTESARRAIGKTRLPGRIIRPRRLFSDETVLNIVSFIVGQNSMSMPRLKNASGSRQRVAGS